MTHLNTGPWNHLLCIGVGGYAGYNWSRWEDEMMQKVNEKRQARGMPAIDRKELMYKGFSEEKSYMDQSSK